MDVSYFISFFLTSFWCVIISFLLSTLGTMIYEINVFFTRLLNFSNKPRQTPQPDMGGEKIQDLGFKNTSLSNEMNMIIMTILIINKIISFL